MVEQLTLNQLVPSSSLGRSTTFYAGLEAIGLFKIFSTPVIIS